MMVGYLDSDSHQNLGRSRQRKALMDNLDAEIRSCKDCKEDDLCETHQEVWSRVHDE